MSETASISVPSIEWRVKIAIGLLLAVAVWRLAEATEKQAYHLGRIDRHLTEEATERRDGGYDLPVEDRTGDASDEKVGEPEMVPDDRETEWSMGDRSAPDGIVDGEIEPDLEPETEAEAEPDLEEGNS